MTDLAALKPGYDPANESSIGPGIIEHRTANCGLRELGTYILRFPQEGHSDPWTVQYEESIYVVEGELDLIVVEDDGTEQSLKAEVGELVVLPRGTTVRYGGRAGTRTVLSISPVNWRERLG